MSFFVFLYVLDFLASLAIINFLVKGNNNKKPKRSVANPGRIRRNAAKAIAAPETIS